MTIYENIVILDALLSDEEINTQIEKTRSIIEQHGLQIIKTDIWGRKRLAYLIKKRRDGYYVLFYFIVKESASRIKDLDKRFRIEENLLRHIIIALEPSESKKVLESIKQTAEKAEEKPAEKVSPAPVPETVSENEQTPEQAE